MYLHSFFVLISDVILLCYSSIWDGVFQQADLTFIFTLDCVDHHDLPNYTMVTSVNSYTPVRIIALCRTSLEFRQSLEMFGYQKGKLEKSARRKVTYIPIESLVHEGGLIYKCEFLINITNNLLRQEYIFAKILNHRDLVCLKRLVEFLGSVKIVVFVKYDSKTMFDM